MLRRRRTAPMRMSALQPPGGHRRARARRVRRRRLGAALLLVAAIAGGAMLAQGAGGRRPVAHADGSAPSQSSAAFARGGHAAATPGARQRPRDMRLTERAAGHLSAAVEDAGAAALGESVVSLGGSPRRTPPRVRSTSSGAAHRATEGDSRQSSTTLRQSLSATSSTSSGAVTASANSITSCVSIPAPAR